jgi:hypothetical protein
MNHWIEIAEKNITQNFCIEKIKNGGHNCGELETNEKKYDSSINIS